MQTIKRLPKSVHSSLRSSIILSDLPRVVEELIYNSIDAKAKKIDISVNVRACYVRVEDDGCGITRDELVLLGEKYATSKFHDIVGDGESISRSFGSNDEALASLSDISVVEVRTKARGRPNSYCKIIKGSKCSHLGIDDQREAVGTTVVVRELFYNQPVRRKQMQSSQKRELHHVKKCVLQIALIHPQVSVRLLDIGSEDELLYTVPSSSPLPLISNSFGDDVSSCLHEIATSDQNWALSGHISGPKDVFCTKDFQYLYVNSRFVSRSPIHSILNNVAATLQSSIIRMNEQIDVQSRKRQKIDVYPAYLLNLCCPRSSYDLHFEPSKCIVEFKDWQSILSFIERTITNYWKMPVPQSSKGVTIDGSTCVPLKGDVKSSQGLLKHHSAQNKEDDAGLYQRSLQKDTGRENNIDKNTATLPKDLHSFSFDMEPSTWDVCYSDRINDASQHSDDVAKNERIVGHKQTYSPARVSCQWLEYDPSQLEDYDISGASPTVRKKQRTEGIFHRNAYSCNFGTLEDVQTKGLLADDQDSEIICPEIQLQEPCFGVLNRPDRITYDFTPSETNMKANILDCDGFHLEFDKLNEDRLLNEDGIACSDMSHFSNGFYHEDFSTSRDFCSVMKRCSGRDGLATVQGYVEGLEANTIDQVNFPDIQAVWGSDSMDRSSIKDIYLHFSYPFSSVDTPLSHSHAATDLELHGRSSKTFADWNCENSDSDFRFALDRFNSDSSPVCEGRKHFNNSADETQPPNYFNHDDCFADQFVSKEKKIPWKSRTDATSSYDISPEKGDTHSHLNVSSSQMANDSLILQYQSNEHNFGCSQRSSFSDEIQTCERPKHFRNSDDETQAPSYFNHDDRFADLLVSEEDQVPRKLKNHATLSYDISPDKSATDFHLGVSSPDMANDSVLIKDPPNQHSFGCVRRSKLSKGRARSCSAPPFYRGKRKFPVLNEPLTKLTAQATAPVPGDITRVNATQPIPETSSSEFSAIHFGLRENVKTFEETCSGGLENSTTPLTKWRNDSDQNAVQHALELPHASFECYDDVLSVSSGPLHLSCSSLVPESIDKNCFEEGRVLLQLDKKFIPVMSGETLLLVDQHAADERIRLEELRRKVLSDEDRGITYFDSEEDLALPETGFQLLQKYTEQIQQWGWIINNSSVSSESFKRNMNILRRQARVVTLAAVPCILGVNLTGKDLMDFIQQLDESDGSSSIPPAIFRILNFKACRGAIMFGDPLLPTECCLIIEQLKATSLCFQCAHGRPTTVPIVNLANLRDELAKLEMLSGRRQEETWHGLSYHGPSLERAQTRLKRLRRLRRGL